MSIICSIESNLLEALFVTATVSVPLISVSDTLTARIASKLRTRDQWRNVSLYIDML